VTKNLVDFTAAWRIDISYGCPLVVSMDTAALVAAIRLFIADAGTPVHPA